jgi:hypothetical protein
LKILYQLTSHRWSQFRQFYVDFNENFLDNFLREGNNLQVFFFCVVAKEIENSLASVFNINTIKKSINSLNTTKRESWKNC